MQYPRWPVASTSGDQRNCLTIVIHALRGGGSEHVAAMMANHWAATGRVITLITLDITDNDSIPVDPRVQRVGLGLMAESSNPWQAVVRNLTRVRALRRAIIRSRPDHVISFVDRMNVLTLLACRGTGLDVIVSERTVVGLHPIGRVWDWLRRRTYPRARAIVVQTEAVRSAVGRMFPRTTVVRIPNCVFPPPDSGAELGPRSTHLSHPPTIGALGRLSHEKGFDLLISAFAGIADQFSEWELVIIGDGEERGRLLAQVAELGLTGRVHLAGWKDQPWLLLQGADVFALPSRYEGFPNALLEAMARGIAVVAFDCPAGPAEIIRPGMDGVLVPNGDVLQLSSALADLISQPQLRQQIGEKAREVLKRFSAQQYFDRWNALLRSYDSDRSNYSAPLIGTPNDQGRQ